ncbi:hypothetical protein MNL13_06485 [Bartonella krasnovii]|uniref:Uncharacterized protein n=2 Tax=Bartonella krasnovii TaxID=2267275 RepID=A0A5B9D3B6_9HYPH|nr:hypothetical protein [Bartonella krasnovii]QEE12735.1 hypothetical protein D1092_07210 [Bartonella krasnovii]UNF28848.1 hypothetical protein MNL13_06485 [Bartonella krasnovii]UNF35218.1 hypothetical protein MNL12_06470 [Bartonella krasnovii]UNF41924.1 hypothetical protein MNL08_07100 [Bartonella krasnovii]UNF51778.1 hypothetical protein MNL02_06915 [Bartonella krasnovii]
MITMKSEAALFIFFLPFGCFLLEAVTVFALFVMMMIMVPYYSLIKHLRLYFRVKEQRRLMKEQPQHFCFSKKSLKEIVQQNLVLNTEISSYAFKKWLSFSNKDYVIHACLSFMVIVFKVYVYVTFYTEVSFLNDEKRFISMSIFFFCFVVCSACILATVPIIIILREILTSRLKKKIQQLEEVTKAPQSINL